MNKIFTIHKPTIKGICKNKPERLPVGEYWLSCPKASEGMLIFTNVQTRIHWIVTHFEWRRGENTGIITSEFKS